MNKDVTERLNRMIDKVEVTLANEGESDVATGELLALLHATRAEINAVHRREEVRFCEEDEILTENGALQNKVDAITAIVQAEFCYWRTSDAEHSGTDDFDLIAMGCMSACANIISALHGHLAPWHPGYEPKQNAADLVAADDEPGDEETEAAINCQS